MEGVGAVMLFLSPFHAIEAIAKRGVLHRVPACCLVTTCKQEMA